MDGQIGHSSDEKSSQIFIITPEELAKLGILDSLSRQNSKSTEKEKSVPSTSTAIDKSPLNKDAKNLLKSFLNKTLSFKSDDREVFKKPSEPGNERKLPQTREKKIKTVGNCGKPRKKNKGKKEITQLEIKKSTVVNITDNEELHEVIACSSQITDGKPAEDFNVKYDSEVDIKIHTKEENQTSKRKPLSPNDILEEGKSKIKGQPNIKDPKCIEKRIIRTNILQKILSNEEEEKDKNIQSAIEDSERNENKILNTNVLNTEKARNKIIILENINITEKMTISKNDLGLYKNLNLINTKEEKAPLSSRQNSAEMMKGVIDSKKTNETSLTKYDETNHPTKISKTISSARIDQIDSLTAMENIETTQSSNMEYYRRIEMEKEREPEQDKYAISEINKISVRPDKLIETPGNPSKGNNIQRNTDIFATDLNHPLQSLNHDSKGNSVNEQVESDSTPGISSETSGKTGRSGRKKSQRRKPELEEDAISEINKVPVTPDKLIEIPGNPSKESTIERDTYISATDRNRSLESGPDEKVPESNEPAEQMINHDSKENTNNKKEQVESDLKRDITSETPVESGRSIRKKSQERKPEQEEVSVTPDKLIEIPGNSSKESNIEENTYIRATDLENEQDKKIPESSELSEQIINHDSKGNTNNKKEQVESDSRPDISPEMSAESGRSKGKRNQKRKPEQDKDTISEINKVSVKPDKLIEIPGNSSKGSEIEQNTETSAIDWNHALESEPDGKVPESNKLAEQIINHDSKENTENENEEVELCAKPGISSDMSAKSGRSKRKRSRSTRYSTDDWFTDNTEISDKIRYEKSPNRTDLNINSNVQPSRQVMATKNDDLRTNVETVVENDPPGRRKRGKIEEKIIKDTKARNRHCMNFENEPAKNEAFPEVTKISEGSCASYTTGNVNNIETSSCKLIGKKEVKKVEISKMNEEQTIARNPERSLKKIKGKIRKTKETDMKVIETLKNIQNSNEVNIGIPSSNITEENKNHRIKNSQEGTGSTCDKEAGNVDQDDIPVTKVANKNPESEMNAGELILKGRPRKHSNLSRTLVEHDSELNPFSRKGEKVLGDVEVEATSSKLLKQESEISVKYENCNEDHSKQQTSDKRIYKKKNSRLRTPWRHTNRTPKLVNRMKEDLGNEDIKESIDESKHDQLENSPSNSSDLSSTGTSVKREMNIPNSSPIQEASSITEHEKLARLTEETIPEVALKKKRGRKPKSVEPPPPLEVTETTRRGRRHVKINYSEMDNGLVEFEHKSFGDSSDFDPKKKRGRKSKSLIPLLEAEVQNNSKSSDEAANVNDSHTPDTVKGEEDGKLTNNPRLLEQVGSNMEKSDRNEKHDQSISSEENENTINESNISVDSSFHLPDLPVKKKTGIKSKSLQPHSPLSIESTPNEIITQSIETPGNLPIKKRGRKRKSEQDTPPPRPNIELPTDKTQRERKRAKIDDSVMEEEGIDSEETIERTIPESDECEREPKVDKDVDETDKPIRPTAKMISEIFSAGLNAENSAKGTNLKMKKKLGRNKKDLFEIDDEGKVTCSLCEEKFELDDWDDHDAHKHNCLSWRKGEPVVCLNEPTVVKTKLKSILSRDKSLVCAKCNFESTRVKDFLEHLEECRDIVKNGTVSCAVCDKSMAKGEWIAHKMKHNNLAWRKGDRPIDLNDETRVLQVLNALYKARKPLYCEKCGTVKKSVIGLLSHRTQCGDAKSAKVSCELCGKKMLPVSMPTHIKMVHETVKKNPSKSNYFDVDLELAQERRTAARNAMAKIDEFKGENSEKFKYYVQNMDFESDTNLITHLKKELEDDESAKCKIKGCDFCCGDTTALLTHMTTCSLRKEQYYTCTKCFSVYPSEEEIIEHMKTHGLKIKKDVDYVYDGEFDMDDEIVDGDHIQNKRNNVATRSTGATNSGIPLYYPVLSKTNKKADPRRFLFSHAYQYTREFCQNNFELYNPFESWKCEESQWDLLEENSLDEYLPSSEVSCDVYSKKVKEQEENIHGLECEFKNYELFEVDQDKAHITIYCGGPVLSLAWLPTPYTSFNNPQLLAVATGKDFDGRYLINENYTESTLIQFWNFGILKNCKEWSKPILDFCLAVDNGPIWQMEWCPSSCYNANDSVEWSRRGLLATAGSTMPVQIYSIPLLKEKQVGLMYRTKPLVKLQLVVDEHELKRKVFPSRISWSKVSGHSYIAVGYTDGTAAIYDLNSKSSRFLHFEDETSTDILLPYKIIKAHAYFISALSFVPIDKGNRWLMTSSFDKAMTVWDLYSDEKISVRKNKVIADGAWLTNWLCHITTTDESTPVQSNMTAAVHVHREYLHDSSNLSNSQATICSISASDWLNGFVHSNTVGEIHAFFPHQMLAFMGRLRKLKSYRFLTEYTVLIDRTLSPEERLSVENKRRKIVTQPRKRDNTTEPDPPEEGTMNELYEPLDYKRATRQYGVVFCDLDSPQTLPYGNLDSECSRPNLYPLRTINKICYNPNRQASLYYASGYQIGFVRLSYLKILEEDEQVTRSQKNEGLSK